jgi:hypothetical protein
VISLSSLDLEGPDRPLSDALKQKLIIPRKSQLREERDAALFLICSTRIAPAAALVDACRDCADTRKLSRSINLTRAAGLCMLVPCIPKIAVPCLKDLTMLCAEKHAKIKNLVNENSIG